MRDEYVARGETALFAELLPFAGFEPGDDERYAAAASRTGRATEERRLAVAGPPAPPEARQPGKSGGLRPAGTTAIGNRRSLWLALGALAVAASVGAFLFTRPKLPANRPDVTGFEQVATRSRVEAAGASPATATKGAPFVNSLGMKFVPVVPAPSAAAATPGTAREAGK